MEAVRVSRDRSSCHGHPVASCGYWYHNSHNRVHWSSLLIDLFNETCWNFVGGLVRFWIRRSFAHDDGDDDADDDPWTRLCRFRQDLIKAGHWNLLKCAFGNTRVLLTFAILLRCHEQIQQGTNDAYETSDEGVGRPCQGRENMAATGTLADGTFDFVEALRICKFAAAMYGPRILTIGEEQIQLRDTSYQRQSFSCDPTIAFCQATGIHPDDILLQYPESKSIQKSQTAEATATSCSHRGYLVHYKLSLHHEHQQIVLAIRGSFSLDDLLVPLETDTIGFCGGQAHRGMVRMATTLWDQCHKIIVSDAVPSHYQFIVTGHSLGGGIAELLTIMIRTRQLLKSRPSPRCFVFASLPAFVSDQSTPVDQSIRKSIKAFCHGSDVVPFLSMHNFLRMSTALIALDTECRALGLWNSLQLAVGRTRVPNYLHTTVAKTMTASRSQIHESNINGTDIVLPANLTSASHRMMFFQKKMSSSVSSDLYTVSLLNPSKSQRSFLLSRNMMEDHYVSRYKAALHVLALRQQQQQDPSCQSTSQMVLIDQS